MAEASTIPDLSAVVLAGGQSSRMGTDKAMLEVDGIPLVGHIVYLLQALSDDVFISGDRPEYLQFGVPVHADLEPGHGPLGGLAQSLRIARHDRLLVVGCDMPHLQVDLLRAVGSLAFDGDTLVAVRHVDGQTRREPLLAVYRRQCLPVVEHALGAGRRSLHRLLADLDVCELPETWLRTFDPNLDSWTNINTPGEALEAGVQFRREEQS